LLFSITPLNTIVGFLPGSNLIDVSSLDDFEIKLIDNDLKAFYFFIVIIMISPTMMLILRFAHRYASVDPNIQKYPGARLYLFIMLFLPIVIVLNGNTITDEIRELIRTILNSGSLVSFIPIVIIWLIDRLLKI